MKFEKKTLQDLKRGLVRVEELHSSYFVDFENHLEVDNLVELSKIGLFQKTIMFLKRSSEVFSRLLQNAELFQKLRKSYSLSQSDIKYLIDSLEFSKSFQDLSRNTQLCLILREMNVLHSFLNKATHKDILYLTLKSDAFAKSFSQDSASNFEDLKYVAQSVLKPYEIYEFCANTQLVKQTLSSFVLIDEIADKLTELIKKDYQNKKWLQQCKIRDIFEAISFYAQKSVTKDTQEILRLNALNSSIHEFLSSSLTEFQKSTLRTALFNNEHSQNSLQYVLNNSLANNFEFDSLMLYLTKKEKKNLLSI